MIPQRIVNFKDNKLSNRKKLEHFVADFLASFKGKFDKKANTSAMTIVFKTIYKSQSTHRLTTYLDN